MFKSNCLWNEQGEDCKRIKEDGRVLNCMEFENIVVDYSITSSANKRKAFLQTMSVKTISSVVVVLQNSENSENSDVLLTTHPPLLAQLAID